MKYRVRGRQSSKSSASTSQLCQPTASSLGKTSAAAAAAPAVQVVVVQSQEEVVRRQLREAKREMEKSKRLQEWQEEKAKRCAAVASAGHALAASYLWR